MKQKIAGIEMAVTNCTVFDDEFSQSYSVIDYPRCADSIVNAEIRVGSDQESFQFAQRLKNLMIYLATFRYFIFKDIEIYVFSKFSFFLFTLCSTQMFKKLDSALGNF